MHKAIFSMIKLFQVESQIHKILLARKRFFEGIMARLHFVSMRQGAGRHFIKWV